MIPIKLTIQGLYSYQEKQTIDFTKLTSAGLFGIFGAVGSGKSSILEAITYALYNDTDRMNSRDNRAYNMMNLKSNELLIDFEFETGKNQTTFRAVVKGRRNGKDFEKVNAFERSAYRKENGAWIPIEPSSLKEVIKLSYDNFKRTIIIPQGQFQEFLQLGNKDRSQMMMDLFNLKKYELLNKATSLEAKNNAEKQMIDGQLKQLGELDPEQEKLFAEKLQQLKAEMVELNRKIQSNQKLEGDLKNLLELVRKTAENRMKLEQLNAILSEITQLEKKISDYEYCLIHFKNLFETSEASEKKIQQLNEKIQQELGILKKTEAQILTVDQAFIAVKPEFDNRENLKLKAEEIKKLIRLNELSELVVLLDGRIKKGTVFVTEASSAIEKLKLEKQEIEVRLKNEKAKQPDMVALSNAKSWHDWNKNLTQQKASNSLELKKIENEIRQLDQSIIKSFKDEIFSEFSGEQDFDSGIRFLKEKIALLKINITGIDTEMQHLKVQLKLEEYALNLHDGDACPVCGSTHHPEIMSAANVSESLTKLSERKSTSEKLISASEKQIDQLSDLGNKHNLFGQQLKGIQNRHAELERQLNLHSESFKWENFRKDEDVVKAFQAVDQLKKLMDELEKQLEECSKKIDQETANKEKYLLNIEKITNELTVAQTELNTLKAQLKLLNPEFYSGKTNEELSREKNELLKKYAEVEKKFADLSNQLVDLRKTKDTISGSLNANQIQLEQENKLFVEVKLRIEKSLADSDFENARQVLFILNQGLNLAGEKQKVSMFRNELATTQNQLNQLEMEIGDRKYDEDGHQKLRALLEADKDLVSRKNQEFGVTEKSLVDLQKSLEEQKILRETFGKLQDRAENIKTMKSLFTASGFVNYISSVYLQNLCNAANDRFFQLTRQKLSLEITEDNNFQVRDFLNGGKIRSVKTLSGGQTFQAALCLALALADNIQKITESNQNFFFLDEGFGSLDKDSLSIVFDALKSLRKENRIVGVISHVEEMQQEIDTHLRIENHDETGSRILASWG